MNVIREPLPISIDQYIGCRPMSHLRQYLRRILPTECDSPVDLELGAIKILPDGNGRFQRQPVSFGGEEVVQPQSELCAFTPLSAGICGLNR